MMMITTTITTITITTTIRVTAVVKSALDKGPVTVPEIAVLLGKMRKTQDAQAACDPCAVVQVIRESLPYSW